MSDVEILRQEMNAKFDQHDAKFVQGTARFDEIRREQKVISRKVDKLIENTDPIVKFLNDVVATKRMGDRVTTLAWFVTKWSTLIGGAVAWYEILKNVIFGESQ